LIEKEIKLIFPEKYKAELNNDLKLMELEIDSRAYSISFALNFSLVN